MRTLIYKFLAIAATALIAAPNYALAEQSIPVVRKKRHAVTVASGGTPAASPTGGIQYGVPVTRNVRNKSTKRPSKVIPYKSTKIKRTNLRKQVQTPKDQANLPGKLPIAGSFDFGSEDARFGVGRPGHVHQGQDVSAPEGTPVIAPRAGVVQWRRYQASGAGHYLVLRDTEVGRDYVFMHLQTGSLKVSEGEAVAAGQQIATVGSTGRSSGPHLHFEIWFGPWQTGGHPIDPLPQLKRWQP